MSVWIKENKQSVSCLLIVIIRVIFTLLSSTYFGGNFYYFNFDKFIFLLLFILFV